MINKLNKGGKPPNDNPMEIHPKSKEAEPADSQHQTLSPRRDRQEERMKQQKGIQLSQQRSHSRGASQKKRMSSSTQNQQSKNINS